MKSKSKVKNVSTLKQRFRQMIQTLRSQRDFNNTPHLAFKDVIQPIQAELDQHISDIMPSTHPKNSTDQENIQMNNDSLKIVNFPSSKIAINSVQKVRKDSQIVIQDKQQEFQIEDKQIMAKGIQLNPSMTMKYPKNQGRVGQIRHQNTSVNQYLNSRIARISSIRYTKSDNKRQFMAKPLPSHTQRLLIPIKQLDDLQLIKYWNKNPKLDQNSSSSQIYNYFQALMEQLALQISDPMIQKFKNCVYFGQKQCKSVYQGMIYYFSGKVYYGQFVNAVKHGHGVEINFVDNVKYAGIFNGGAKNGYFFVQKSKQNYEGTLQYGLYHGNGKLMTQDCIYTGSFQLGKKHGYGQQIYPKTGLKIQGYFRQGQYQNFNQKLTDKEIQPHLPSKAERKTLKKSQSYDIKVDLTSKLMHRQRSEIIERNQINLPFNRSQQDINEFEFREDSKSLYDLLQNKQKHSKYDIYLDKIASRLPKIQLDGLPQISNQNQEQTIINRKFINNQQENDRVLSRFRHRKIPISYSAPKQCLSSNERLAVRKSVVQTPINNY